MHTLNCKEATGFPGHKFPTDGEFQWMGFYIKTGNAIWQARQIRVTMIQIPPYDVGLRPKRNQNLVDSGTQRDALKTWSKRQISQFTPLDQADHLRIHVRLSPINKLSWSYTTRSPSWMLQLRPKQLWDVDSYSARHASRRQRPDMMAMMMRLTRSAHVQMNWWWVRMRM